MRDSAKARDPKAWANDPGIGNPEQEIALKARNRDIVHFAPSAL